MGRDDETKVTSKRQDGGQCALGHGFYFSEAPFIRFMGTNPRNA
jgi:hypothetical protein